MRTHKVVCAVWFALATGCAKDPNECNPRCGRPPDVIDAVVEVAAHDNGPRDISVDRDVMDVPDADVDGGRDDADRYEVLDGGETWIDADGDVPDGRDDGVVQDEDVSPFEEDVRDEDVVDSDVSVPSLTFTFVSGVVNGSSREATLRAQVVWHGAIRGQSTDGQTKIEAFFH